jgi:hypothetical protein
MNLDIKGALAFYKRRNMTGLLVTDNGRELSDNEARNYLKWCDKNSYRTIKDAPDYDDVKDKIFK